MRIQEVEEEIVDAKKSVDRLIYLEVNIKLITFAS